VDIYRAPALGERFLSIFMMFLAYFPDTFSMVVAVFRGRTRTFVIAICSKLSAISLKVAIFHQVLPGSSAFNFCRYLSQLRRLHRHVGTFTRLLLLFIVVQLTERNFLGYLHFFLRTSQTRPRWSSVFFRARTCTSYIVIGRS